MPKKLELPAQLYAARESRLKSLQVVPLWSPISSIEIPHNSTAELFLQVRRLENTCEPQHAPMALPRLRSNMEPDSVSGCEVSLICRTYQHATRLPVLWVCLTQVAETKPDAVRLCLRP